MKIEWLKAFKSIEIIINNFDELEDEVLNTMPAMLPPLCTVGPLSLLCSQFPITKVSSIGSSFLKEDEDCLEWLDEKKTMLVLYVNFGSFTVVSNEMMPFM